MEGIARERTLRFLLKIDADLAEAEAAIAKLETMLKSIPNQKVIVEIEFDREALQNALDQIPELEDQVMSVSLRIDEDEAFDQLHDTLQNFQEGAVVFYSVDIAQEDLDQLSEKVREAMADETIHIKIDFDQEFFDQTWQHIRDVLNDFTRGTTKIPIGFDLDLSDVEEVRIAVERVREMSGYAHIGVVKSSRTEEEIAQLRQQLREFADETYTATLDVDVRHAEDNIDHIFGMLDTFQRHGGKVTIDVESRLALEKIHEVLEELEKVEQTWTAKIDVDNRSALSKLRYLFGRKKEWDEQVATAELDADQTPALGSIQNITNHFKIYEARKPKATLTVEDRLAKATLQGFNTILTRYSNRWGGRGGIRARITADIAQAQANIRILERMLDSVDDTRRVEIEVQLARQMAELETLRDMANEVGASDPDINVGIRGTLVAAAEMLGLQKLADQLDGTEINIGVDMDERLTTALPQMLGAFEVQLENIDFVMTAFSVVKFPIFKAAMASVPALAAGAAAAVGSLATAIAPGLVGALGIVVGAFGLATASLGTFALAVEAAGDFSWDLSQNLRQQSFQTKAAKDAMNEAAAALKQTTPGTQAHTRAQRALTLATINYNNEARNNKILLESVTPTIIELARTYGRFTNEVTRLKASMADAVSPFLIDFFATLNTVIPKITPGIHDMVEEMGKVGSSFLEASQQGQRLENIKTILSSIRDTGSDTMLILTDSISIFLAIAAQIAPDAETLLHNMQNLTTAANNWINSAEGTRVIGDIWDNMVDVANDLWDISVDLAQGLWGVVEALNASRTGTWLLNQIKQGAQWFNDLMNNSNDASNAITNFTNDVRPLLQHLGPLFAEVGKGVLDLIKLVSQPGGDTGKPFGLLIDILDALKEVVPEVFDVLEHEFKTIAPLLPGLIRELGDFATTFAKNTPEMRLFITGLTDLLGAFNLLPEPVQIALGRLLSWTLAINTLTGGAIPALAGGLGHLISTWTLIRLAQGKSLGGVGLLRGAFNLLKIAVLGLGRGLTIAAGWLAGQMYSAAVKLGPIIGRVLVSAFTSLTAVLGRLGVALLALAANPIVLVIAGVAALVAGFILAYKYSKSFRDAVDNSAKAAIGTSNFAKIAKDGLDGLGDAFSDNRGLSILWAGDLDKVRRELDNNKKAATPFNQAMLDIATTFRQEGGTAGVWAKGWGGAIDHAKKAFNSLPQPVQTALTTVTGVVHHGSEAVKLAMRGDFKGAADEASKAFQSLPPGIRQKINAVRPAASQAAKAVGAALHGDFDAARKHAEQAWAKLPPGVRQKLAPLRGVFRGAATIIKGIISSNWGQVAKGASQIWHQIPQQTRQKLKGLGQAFRGAGNLVAGIIRGNWKQTSKGASQIWGAIPKETRQKLRPMGQAFRGVGNVVRGIMQGDWKRVAKGGSQLWGLIPKETRQKLRPMGQVFKGTANVIRGVVKGDWGRVKKGALQLWQSLPPETRKKLKPLGPAFKGVAQILKGIVKHDWGQVKKGILTLWQQIPPETRKKLKLLGQIFKDIGGIILGVVTGNWEKVREHAINLWNKLPPGVRQKLKELGPIVRDIGQLILDILRGKFGSAVEVALKILEKLAPGVAKKLQNAIDRAQTFVDKFVQLGSSIINGIIQGLNSGSSTLAGAVSNIIQGALSSGQSTAQQGSPSRLFDRELGVPLALGIAQGVMRAAPEAVAALLRLISDMLRAGTHVDAPELGLRTQVSEMDTLVRQHRAMISWNDRVGRSYEDMGRRAQQAMMAAREAHDRQLVALRRNAEAMARLKQEQERLRVFKAQRERARREGESRRSIQMRNQRVIQQRERVGAFRQAARATREEMHVYVHTDGPGADAIENEQLASAIAAQLHRRRRRGR